MIAEESVEHMVFSDCYPEMGVPVGRLTWKVFSILILENIAVFIVCVFLA